MYCQGRIVFSTREPAPLQVAAAEELASNALALSHYQTNNDVDEVRRQPLLHSIFILFYMMRGVFSVVHIAG